MTPEILTVLKELIHYLCRGETSTIIINKMNGRLSENEIIQAIADYPGTITLPPDDSYLNAYVYDVYDPLTSARKVEFDLWYDNNISDLTLSADVHKNENGEYQITIEDIHVL
jgi:hypothetical protein